MNYVVNLLANSNENRCDLSKFKFSSGVTVLGSREPVQNFGNVLAQQVKLLISLQVFGNAQQFKFGNIDFNSENLVGLTIANSEITIGIVFGIGFSRNDLQKIVRALEKTSVGIIMGDLSNFIQSTCKENCKNQIVFKNYKSQIPIQLIDYQAINQNCEENITIGKLIIPSTFKENLPPKDLPLLQSQCTYESLNTLQDCNPGMLLKNIGSWRCYMDAVLMALLYKPSRFIVENLLQKQVQDDNNCTLSKIQEHLCEVSVLINKGSQYTSIRALCTNFLELVNICSQSRGYERLGEQGKFKDTVEFYNFLAQVFEFEPVAYHLRATISNEIIQDAVNAIVFSDDDLNAVDNPFDMINFEYNTAGYDIMVFTMNRYIGGYDKETKTFVDVRFNPKQIIPPREIALTTVDQREKMYLLSSVVVYRGRHYTCYVRCNDMFYHYNDLGPTFDLVGDYNNLLQENRFPNITTNGVLFIYKELEEQRGFGKMGYFIPKYQKLRWK